jgi:hypothetical protein
VARFEQVLHAVAELGIDARLVEHAHERADRPAKQHHAGMKNGTPIKSPKSAPDTADVPTIRLGVWTCVFPSASTSTMASPRRSTTKSRCRRWTCS